MGLILEAGAQFRYSHAGTAISTREDEIDTGKKSISRSLNRTSILATIMERGQISRTEIARLTGLNQSTVSRIIAKFIAEGLVNETGTAPSGRQNAGTNAVGRRPVDVKLNPNSRLIGVIVINPWTTDISLLNLSGERFRGKRLVTITEDAESFLSACASVLKAMIDERDIPLAGVAVTVPGLVDCENAFIRQDPYLNWKNIDVGRILGEKIKEKVFLENDVRAAALAHVCFDRSARNLSGFVLVMVDIAIWASLVINNIVYHGYNGHDGQLGAKMIATDKRNPRSQMVSLNDLASETSMVRRYCEVTGKPVARNIDTEIRRVLKMAMNGDEEAIGVLKQSSRYLGESLADIYNLLNPEKIIVAGKITRVWDIIYPEILEEMNKFLPDSSLSLDDVVRPSSLVWPSFEGASALVVKNFIGGYQIIHRRSHITDWQTGDWGNWDIYEHDFDIE